MLRRRKTDTPGETTKLKNRKTEILVEKKLINTDTNGRQT